MTHNINVPYLCETITPENLVGWNARENGGHVSVAGPCPKCGGDAYGPTLPQLEKAGEVLEVVPSEERRGATGGDIIAECRCGDDHGEPKAGNCGRSWFIRAKVQGKL